MLESVTSFIFNRSIPFEDRMARVFSYQYGMLPQLRAFSDMLERPAEKVADGALPPLLPVEAFREARLCTAPVTDDMLSFRSSGTTGMKRSVHYVPFPELYEESVVRGIQAFYDTDRFTILACTPGYSDNPDSSLIWMLDRLIRCDSTGLSRFLQPGESPGRIVFDAVRNEGKRVMLFGAAFGLLDLAEQSPVLLPEDSIIIETGGMKTHRREISKEDLRAGLASSFGLPVSSIHSEYGMTEMLSQAYADGSGWFSTPHWLKISIRNPEDPMVEVKPGQQGLIGVIDLANYYSCSFLLTGDKGVAAADGRFRVLGRYVPENLRGCNFLIDQEADL